ncbi:MAG: AAA family ATPase [Firmicutes bacterium HGW-Firmicutes-15]|nr:MAG: AAA family ATPase [Firmicutes bacterium HGW-Firmicutes-15]
MKNDRIYNNDSAFDAKYIDQKVSEYKNNPLIEALPPIWSEEKVIDMLRTYAPYDPGERLLEPEIRGHCVEKLFHIFEPLDRHLELEQKLSRVIRQGYIGRSPLSPEYARTLQENYRVINNGSYEIPDDCEVGTSALSFAVIGYSGVGKSKGIERILKLYPRLLYHTNYKGIELSLQQVPWIKIDCPFNGTLTGLCYSFFKEVDKVIGSNNYARVKRERPNMDILIGEMAQTAYLHCLGVLVVDEIQRLKKANSEKSEQMINFFVSLVNTMNVPVVLIGTAKAKAIFQGEFAPGRRLTGQGNVIWERMQKDGLWDIFIKIIWKYQWTDEETLLTEELTQVLYEESQGIIDVAIKIYAIAQWELLVAGYGQITPDFLREICKNNLQLIKPMLDAIKSNDVKRIARYEDIAPLEIEVIRDKYLALIKQNVKKDGSSNKAQALIEQATMRLVNVGFQTAKARQAVKEAIESSNSGNTIEEIASKALDLALYLDRKPSSKQKIRPIEMKKNKTKEEKRNTAKRDEKSDQEIYDEIDSGGKIKPPLGDILE